MSITPNEPTSDIQELDETERFIQAVNEGISDMKTGNGQPTAIAFDNLRSEIFPQE